MTESFSNVGVVRKSIKYISMIIYQFDTRVIMREKVYC